MWPFWRWHEGENQWLPRGRLLTTLENICHFKNEVFNISVLPLFEPSPFFFFFFLSRNMVSFYELETVTDR